MHYRAHRPIILFSYLSLAALSFVFVGLLSYRHPETLPFGLFEFWHLKGSL